MCRVDDGVDGCVVASFITATASAVPVILLTGWGHCLPGEQRPEYVDGVFSKTSAFAGSSRCAGKVGDRQCVAWRVSGAEVIDNNARSLLMG